MASSAVQIAAANEADFSWCAHLMASNDPWITLGRGYETCLARLRNHDLKVLVARKDDQPLGFVLLHENGVAGSPYIAAIAVDQEARGAGVGTALVEYAEGFCPAARHMFLCVSSFNHRARQLYERLGYRVVGELPDYVVEGSSETLMCKRLVHS